MNISLLGGLLLSELLKPVQSHGILQTLNISPARETFQPVISADYVYG
jgi:hypothetical protein